MFAIDTIDERRETIADATPKKHKSAVGQFFTPSIIANFMVAMFRGMQKKHVQLLDAGSGIGSLTAAFVQRAATEGVSSLHVEAWEIDTKLHKPMHETLDACGQVIRQAGGSFNSIVQPSAGFSHDPRAEPPVEITSLF